MPIDPIIPGGPSITHHEIEHVASAGASGWNTKAHGYVHAFMQTLQQHTGQQHSLVLSSCTGAMHIALAALGLSKGDEVLVPDLADFSAAACVAYCGATPVFCDIDPETLCISPSDAAHKVTPRTRGLIAVHMYGQPCRMQPLLELAEQKGLFVLEDATLGIGSKYAEKPAGSFGHFAVFSFKGTTSVVAGEGGALLTSDKKLFLKAARLSTGGRSESNPFLYDSIGFNYTISNMQAALGYAQMLRLDELLTQKKQIHAWYGERLADTPGIRLNAPQQGSEHSFLSPLVFIEDANTTSADLIARLRASDVLAEPIFFPVSSMPMFSRAETPLAYAAATKTLRLPSGHNRTEEEIDYICGAIKQLLAKPGLKKAQVQPTGWLKSKSEILEKIAHAKQHGLSLPFTHKGRACSLRAITSADALNPDLLALFARWRRISTPAFLTRPPVTEEFMLKIMKDYANNVRDFLLFFVMQENRIFGQVGLDEFAFQKHECVIDALIMEKNAPRGLAAAANETLFEWAKTALGIKSIYNHVVASNRAVRLLAAAQDFKEISRTGLYRVDIPGGEMFRPMYLPGHDTPDEYLLICKKSLV